MRPVAESEGRPPGNGGRFFVSSALGIDHRDFLHSTVRDAVGEDLGRLGPERCQNVDLFRPARVRDVERRGLGFGPWMAVIDADEVPIGVVCADDRVAQLRRIYLVARLGRRVDVAPANEATRHFTVAEEQPAALAWRRVARVSDDLLAKAAREDEPSTSAQRPPAIAGMTMTSLPSGTAAPLPPRLRTSSSPMYTFTYERSAPFSSSTREAKPGWRLSISDRKSASVSPDALSLVSPPAASRSAPGRRTVTAMIFTPKAGY